ncbi:hypothetical protein [Nocardia nova]|uniref:hypothetical protein n=1 Tax=Nocardia nova TaxID=37330 RepID=UPI00189498E6|nr:hypothetical protein [Nocardia nova]MBF6277052.1 hypothetical protein [Nocardia nova]
MADMTPAGRAARSLGGVALALEQAARTGRPLPSWRLRQLSAAIREATEVLNDARKEAEAAAPVELAASGQ